jgi:hypothetical protein
LHQYAPQKEQVKPMVQTWERVSSTSEISVNFNQ